MRIVFLFMLCLGLLQAGSFPVNIAPNLKEDRFMGIEILDQKQLSFAHIDGIKFSEISDVAYYQKVEKLFLVSDEGKLFTFKAKFTEKIEDLQSLSAVQLTKKDAKKFKKWRRDSEGMTLDGKGRLLISFEGKAKIGWFHKNSNRYGNMIRTYKLPRQLRNPKNYRSRNKSLEALAWHSRYGILTAAEWPLKKENKKRHTVYSLNGKKWHFKAEPEGKSSVVAMEVMDDGNLLILERSYTGLMNPFVVTLKKVYIQNCKKTMCKTKVVAKMDSHKGWDVDNFEGLAKVGKDRYVMISDDNDNFFQKTLLIYFEVLQ